MIHTFPAVKKAIVLLVAIGFLVYFPTFFGSFIWDDEDFVYQNQYVKEFRINKFLSENAIAGRGKISNYYRPIQLTTYAMVQKIFGFQPIVYHATSIIVHIAATLVVFLFLYLFINDRFVAFITSLVFLIHPVQTESVSYVSGLSDPLFVLFLFLSFYFYLRTSVSRNYFFLSIISFVLALLSKELAVVGMGIIVLLSILVRRNQRRTDIPFLMVYELAGFLYLILRFTLLKFQSIERIWEGTLYGSSIVLRLATFFHNFFVYLFLLVFPKDLYMERDFTVMVEKNIINRWTLLFLLFHIALFILFKLLARKRMEQVRHVLFFYGAFLISILPFTGVIPLNGIFYEHYLYLPMIFFWGCVLTLVKPLLKHKMSRVILYIVLILFVGRSYLRQYEWINAVRFYEQTLIRAPKSTRIINNLGMEQANRGKLDQAIATYEKGLIIDPSVPNFYHNLANAYKTKGDFSKAEELYYKAIKVDPNFYFSYLSLIQLYFDRGHKEQAMEFLKNKAIPAFPNIQNIQLLYNQLQKEKQ